MSSSVRFRVGLVGAGLVVVVLAGALLYLGRGTPRSARRQGGDGAEIGAQLGAEAGAEVGAEVAARADGSGARSASAGGPRAGQAPPAQKPLERAWRWMMGDGQSQPSGAAGTGGDQPGGVASPEISATGEAPRPKPHLELSERRPARDPAKDDSSPTLARLLEVTRANASQEQRIRELWRKHEEERRQIFARMMPSVAPPEVKMKLELEANDGEMEITMIREILDQQQADRMVAEMHPQPVP